MAEQRREPNPALKGFTDKLITLAREEGFFLLCHVCDGQEIMSSSHSPDWLIQTPPGGDFRYQLAVDLLLGDVKFMEAARVNMIPTLESLLARLRASQPPPGGNGHNGQRQ